LKGKEAIVASYLYSIALGFGIVVQLDVYVDMAWK